MSAKSKPNEIKIIRLYEAPVKLVWDAWTDPEKVAQWWGPRGFTLTHHSKDLRPGGHWHYTMHGPDGVDYPNRTIYHEVEEYQRLVYDHGGYEDRPPLFQVTVIFHDLGARTKMEMTMALPTAEEAQKTKKFIKEVGGNSTWDRLAEFLEADENGKEVFVINRSFETSPEQMFEIWTDPKHIAKWLAPTGVRMEYIDVKIAEGETAFYMMTNDKDLTMYGKINYLKLESPNHLQYVQWFCDEKGGVSRHPMVPTWPEKMMTHVYFQAEEDNQCRVTVVWSPDGDYTKEELQAFIQMKAGMTQGWTGSFDKLEEYIENT